VVEPSEAAVTAQAQNRTHAADTAMCVEIIRREATMV
jgi:hypothetical protein